jgi:hypothetical protein
MAVLQKGTTTNTTSSNVVNSNNMQQQSGKEQLPSEYWMSYIEVRHKVNKVTPYDLQQLLVCAARTLCMQHAV